MYSNASLILVVADGRNTDYGLLGVEQVSQARDMSCDIVRFP